MTITILGIISLIVGVILLFFGTKKNVEMLAENIKIEEENTLLKAEQIFLKNEQAKLLTEQSELTKINDAIYQKLNNIKIELRDNYYHYCEELDRAYTLKEKNFDGQIEVLKAQFQQKKIEIDEEYNVFLKNLENTYEIAQQEIIKQIENHKEELEKWKNTREAALEAHRREQEIELQSDFYRLHLSESDRVTINLINELKPRLPEPRVLCMLVWQTFYQKKMKELCTKILGTKIKCGIYKITNLKTGMCYIGQAVNVDTRWKDHAKCGLGIDTPVGNKLYQAMLKDGLESFTFELLEEVPAAILNEKEKFYIDLYNSCDFGYNSTKGNK